MGFGAAQGPGINPLKQYDLSSDPASVVNVGQLYWKDLGSGNELYAEDESGNVTQITASGGLNNRAQIGYTKSGALEVDTNICFPFRPSGTFTISEVYIECKTAPTGSTLIIDVNKNGTTIFTDQNNRPAIAISGTTATSGTPDVTSFAKDDQITIDIDQIGSGDSGEDLTIQVRGTTA